MKQTRVSDLTPPRGNGVFILCLLLVAATLAFYNPIVHNQFVDFDNLAYILNNYHVQAGLTWATVKWSFTTFYQGNWHPLSWLSHALDCQAFGLNPAGHHYTSLLIHAANAVLLFLILRRATGATVCSVVVAALFALHPVNVESIAWVAERKTVLSALFFLLALGTYDRYVNSGRRSFFFAVVAFFALGLMAKAQIITLPFVLLLWDYWPLRRMAFAPNVRGDVSPSGPRSFAYLAWEKWPLFVLAAAGSIVTVIAQRAGNSVRTLTEVSLGARLQLVLVSYVRYIGKAFWPSHLVPLYPRPENAVPIWQLLGAAAVLLLISGLALRWRDRGYLLVGWLWFLGTLVPMIGLVTVGDQAIADRYAYISFIGLFIAVVWSFDALSSAVRIGFVARAVVAVLVVCILGWLTHQQVGYWRDDETLWRYTLSVTERNYVAHNNLALALTKLGQSDEAIRQFRAGSALHKYPPSQTLALAAYELRSGHIREAMEDSNDVLRENPESKTQAAAWGQLGEGYLQLRQYDLAAESYKKAIGLNPDDSDALVGTALLELRDQRPDLAVRQLFRAVQVNPSDADVLLFAEALRRAGRPEEADAATAQVQKIAADVNRAKLDAANLLSLVGLKPI